MTSSSSGDTPTIHWWDLMSAPRFSTARAAAHLKKGWQIYVLPMSYCSAGAAGSYSHLLVGPARKLAQITTRVLAQLPCISTPRTVRFFSPVLLLDVGFDEKEIVKGLGARWNPALRKWCARLDDETRFKRWLPHPLKIHDITTDLIGA